MGSRQEEPFCIHESVKMYERQGLYGTGYQFVLPYTPSPEGVAPHILTDFRGVKKNPHHNPQIFKPCCLLCLPQRQDEANRLQAPQQQGLQPARGQGSG